MINIHYDNTTGNIIAAYHDSCPDTPSPFITVADDAWSTVCNFVSRKVDLATLTLSYDKKEPDRKAVQKQIRDIDTQITALEDTQTRQVREITLGLDTDGTAKAKLIASNTEITALRTQRATLIASLTA